MEHVFAGRVEIDPLKIAEIDRVGAGRPRAAEEVGIGHLKPEAAPAAGRMAVEQAGAGIGDGRKGAFDIGNELFHQGRAARAVGRAVGEDVVAGAAVGIEHHPDEVLAERRPRAVRDARGHGVVAAEPRDDVERRHLGLAVPLRDFPGQDDGRAMLDRAVVKSRELRAGQLDQLDAVGRRKLARLDRVVDREGDRCPLFGIEPGMHDRAVRVALAVADLVGVEIEPDDGLDGVSPGLELVEPPRESRRTGNRFATAHRASSSRRPRQKTAAAETSWARTAARRRNRPARETHKPAP